MAKQRTQGSGCLAAAIAILLIIAIITAAVVVMLNLTPDQIGLADVKIYDGKSANDLEMAGSKIKEVLGYILEKISSKGAK